jgi:hypothetical protein
MWLVRVAKVMAYIELVDVEIGVGVESGNGVELL